jgi:general stress protein 26
VLTTLLIEYVWYYYLMRNKQEVFEFLNGRPLMILSTLSPDGKPQSAVVGFGQTDDLELVFGTSLKSRKFKNIGLNPNVSAVIGWDDGGTLQYEGTARILEGSEADKYSDMYFSKNVDAKRYKDDSDERYILISPSWLRFTEVAFDPWQITELQFD